MINKKKLLALYKTKKKKIKLEKILKEHYIKLPLTVTMLLLVLVFIGIGIFKSPVGLVKGSRFGQVISTSLSSGSDLNHLDFNNVERFEVPNATKTVIFIPQLHKEPTSNASDKTNDQALIVQKEISSMLKTLVLDNHVTYVMDETDNYGAMPADKIEKIKTGFANIEKLRSDVQSLADHYVKNGGSPDTAKKVVVDANTKIDGYERAIYLTGGAAVLAATDGNAHVYGSQNPATIKEATKQLQNIVYIEQRISQLDAQTASGSGRSSSSGSQASILAMLGSDNKTSSGSALQPIKDFAKKTNDTDLQAEIDKLTSESNAIASQANYETAPAATTTSAQTQTNPYANETNLAKLKKMDTDATAKFMKLAKDQRSQEAADNMDKMMSENSQTTGVLVMGLQHKDQLVSAFNKKGINVIVITPESEDAAQAK